MARSTPAPGRLTTAPRRFGTVRTRKTGRMALAAVLLGGGAVLVGGLILTATARPRAVPAAPAPAVTSSVTKQVGHAVYLRTFPAPPPGPSPDDVEPLPGVSEPAPPEPAPAPQAPPPSEAPPTTIAPSDPSPSPPAPADPAPSGLPTSPPADSDDDLPEDGPSGFPP